MSERRRVLVLIGIMAVVVAVVSAVTMALLYRAALDDYKTWLTETAQSQVRLAESVYRHEQSERRNARYAAKVTLSRLREASARMKWSSRTGEFEMAQRQGDWVQFLIHRDRQQADEPERIPFRGDNAVPMRRALSGQAGAMVGIDWRGKGVLAAYEPIAGPGWGVVVKIELAEIQEPFQRAAVVAGLAALALALGGAVLFVRITNPLFERIRESEARYRALFDRASDGIFLVSPDGRLIAVNESFARMHGYTASGMLNMRLEDLDTPESRELIPERMRRLLAGESLTFEVGHYHRDGHVIQLEVSASVISIGEDTVIETIHRDITERKRAEEKLLEMSLVDELTGLNNRRGFAVLGEQLLKTANRFELGVALIYMDVDGMKSINDTLGHSEGDRALIDAAGLLRKSFRASDVTARLGGDEFVGLAVETTRNSASVILARLESNLAAYSAGKGRDHQISISYGAARHEPGSPCSIDELLERGDQLMYENKRSKASGRDVQPTPEQVERPIGSAN